MALYGVPRGSQFSPASAIAWRWSRRSVLSAIRACQRSTRSMVIAAWAKALVALWRARLAVKTLRAQREAVAKVADR